MEPATLYIMLATQGQQGADRLYQLPFPSVAACEDYVTEWRRTAMGRTILRYECQIDWPMENEPPPYWTLPRYITIAK